MRPVSGLFVGTAVTITLVGCSLMVSFDDPGEAPEKVVVGKDSGKADRAVPGDDDDDTATTTTTSSSSSSSSSGSSGDSGTVDPNAYPPPCATTVDLTAIDCNGAKRPICARYLPLAAGVAVTDLVECDANSKATCVRKCTTGCADRSATGSAPGQCANCKDRNGWFCGKDVGFVAGASDVAIHCINGVLENKDDAAQVCGVGGSKLCHTKCTRTSPPPLEPSCCQSAPEP